MAFEFDAATARPDGEFDPSTATPVKPAGAIRRVADTGLALAKGAVGVPEAAVGVLNLTTGGKAGKMAENAGVRFKDAKDTLTSFQSDEQHAADAEVQNADGFLPTVGAMVRNPSTIANALAESVPSMLGAGAISRGALRSGLIRNPITAGAAGEGVLSAGQTAEQVRQETPGGTLSDKQALVSAGSGALTGVINRVSGGVANKLGITDVNTALASGKLGALGEQALEKGASKGAVRKIAEGAANEGVLQELPQSAQEQAAQNIALDKPVGEGVAQAAASGLIVGGLMGGGANVFEGGESAPQDQTTKPANQVGVIPKEPGGVSASPETGGFDPETAQVAQPAQPAQPAQIAQTRDVQDVQTKSQAMGIDPNAGPVSAAAALAVDGGAAEVVQRQQAEIAAAEAAKKSGAKGAVKKPAETTGKKSQGASTGQPGPVTQAVGQSTGAAAPATPAVGQTGSGTTSPAVAAGQGLDRQALSTPTGAGAASEPGMAPAAAGNDVPRPSNASTPDAPAEKPSSTLGTPAASGRAPIDTKAGAPAVPARPAEAQAIPSASQPPAKAPIVPREASTTKEKASAPETAEAVQGQTQRRQEPAAKGPASVDAGSTTAKPAAAAAVENPAQGTQSAGSSKSLTVPQKLSVTFGGKTYPVESIEDAQRKWIKFQETADGGSPVGVSKVGNGVQITDQDGKFVARISFNGRVWDGEGDDAKVLAEAPQLGAKQEPAVIDTAAHEAATSPRNDRPEPTDAQKKAGNYPKGHVRLAGMDLSIENPAESVRSGTDKGGKTWTNTLQHHYGYIKGTIGNDKDHVDTFVKPDTPLDYTGMVFVVDQVNPDTGKFDEHKVMIGFDNPVQARAAYQANYAKGWKGLKAITAMPMAEFKTWVYDGPKNKELAQEKAAGSDPAAGKWYDTKEKADKKLADLGLTDTHEVVRDGLRFELRKKDAPKAEAKPEVAPPAAAAPETGPSKRVQLREVAKRLGITVVEGYAGRPHAGDGYVEVPDMDVDTQGAVTPNHVFAHELGHSIMQRRGMSFKRFPVAEMRKWVSNWDEWVAASKAFRPGIHGHTEKRIRDHASKPDEIIADAIGAVLMGEQDIALIRPLMEKTGLTEIDLGLEEVPAKPVATPDKKAPAPKGLGEQLAEVNAELERQGRVQNAATTALRDSIRRQIAQEDFPDVLKAVDGNLYVAEALNSAFKYAGDEPKAKTIERVLKNQGITPEYQARYTERLLDGQQDELDGEMQSYEGKSPAQTTLKRMLNLGDRPLLDDLDAATHDVDIGFLKKLHDHVRNLDSGTTLEMRDRKRDRIGYLQSAIQAKETGKGGLGKKPTSTSQAPTGPRVIVNKLGPDGLTDAERAAGKPGYDQPAAKPDDLDAMFDDVLAEEVAKDAAKAPKQNIVQQRTAQAKAAKAPNVVQQRTASQAAASAAKNTGAALGNAIDGLGALFGGKGRLGSGLSFDEDTYAKAKPLFQAAIANLKDAGGDLREAMRTVIRMVLDKFGADAANNMKPYVVRFMGDVQSGALETQPEKADTATEATNDPTPPTDSPALDQPLDAGQPQDRVPETDPVRGAQQPRDGVGRADDRDVRDERGPAEKHDDGQPDLGNGSGVDAVPDAAPGDVESGGAGLPTRDFRPGPGDLTREGSWFQTAKRNLDLIELAIAIDGEKRQATPEEQALLSKYVGFGAGEIRNNIFPIAGEWERKQNPGKLIFPDLVRDARWKPLAERAAALPIEWQRTILQSTQYAHYTSEGIIRSIWSAVQRLGFTGGKVFEPGGGIGSFAMLMPDSVHQTSKFTGIEFDAPTALIARLLSPDQNMLHGDFIKRSLPDDFFDVSVGNPPFSQTQILADPRYEKHKFMLHDFFFAKSIDKVRPGGLLAFVTSKGTMDKQTDKARKYLAARADFLGAVRLPSTAFEDNAGTSVVTDVIFLRKRAPGDEPAGLSWNNVKTVETKDGPVVINEYFADHPEMVLGQNRISGNVDDMGRRINSNGRGGEKYTVVSYDSTAAELDAKFAAAIEKLPSNVYSPLSQDSKTVKRETAKMDFDPKVKREGVVYVGKNGDLLRVEQGVGKVLSEVVKLSAKDKAWLKSYVGLRDLIQEARHAQVTDGNWKAALKKLNTAYDKFVAEHGPVNAFRLQVRKSTDEEGNEVESATRVFLNRRLFREDYDSAMVTSLEVIDEDGNVKKGVFLRDRTIGKPVTREIKTIGDALAVSLDETGHLDLDDVAQRLKITRDEAIDSLGNQIYKTPQGQWQLADEYLSGDVVAKLAEAHEAARLDPSLERNAQALKDVQPEKLGPSQISVKLGAPWVNVEHVNEFSKEIEAGEVTFDPKTESWQVEGGNMRSQRKAGAEFGTADRSPSELLEAILNSRSLKVTKTVDKKTVTDEAATTAANEMAKKIRDKFKSWVWTDSDRAADLVEAYNLRYNNLAPRRFDGSHLTLPGVSLRYKLHPHQLRAIWRQIQTGDTYLAHAVGAGKTIEMIAGGMEQKRLGLIRKPIYVVPNHMLEQFSNEFMELYPLANIMVADDQNFSKERRKAFVAAATLNAPDAIVITHDAFQRIGVKEESVNPIRDEILEDLQDELDAVAKDAGARVRRGQLEQQIEAVNQRFDSILAAGKKDGIVSFEEMGVDFVYVDEAHTYRKLDFHTAQSIKGIDPNGSRRALDMYVKTRWLEKQRPGRAMVFASGTAVTNTMGELYTIMRFFDPETLDAGGISTFDSWARMFGEVGSALEPNAAGKYEIVERFSKFDNVPELMARVRKFMDVLQSDQLGAIVKRPDTEGGKPQMIMVEPTQAVKDYQKYVLEPRLKASREWKPSKDEPNNPDPVIAIITDGRFAGVDPRFTPGGKVLKGETTKIDRAADEIIAEYKATAKNAYVDRDGKTMATKGGTQIVFYNVGFGANAAASRGFNSRQVFTKRLTDGKIPREQIAWFDDADTDAKKESIFKGMRNGTYRVLIGSAKKMGTGVNVQNRLTALHYMDPPWYPADVEQPRGRIIRQGNQNAIVREKWYATKGGYDSTMWQMVGRKQRFIDQAFSGDKNLRSMDDLGEASLYEQAAALASGDPRALKLAGLKQDVQRLERQQAAHANEQINARHALKQAQWGQEANAKKKVIYEKAQKAIGGGYFTFTAGKVGNATYTKQTEFGQAIKDAFNKNAAAAQQDPGPDVRDIGTIGENVAIKMHAEFEWKEVGTGKEKERVSVRSGEHSLTITAGGYTMDIASGESFGADVDALGLARKMVNALNGIDADLRRTNANLAEIDIDMNRLRKKIGAPFEHQQEMLEKYGELKELEEELRLEGLASGADRIMLDGKGRGWKIIKGPYKQDGVMLVTAERLDENGQTDTQELRFDSLKDAPPALPVAQEPLAGIDFDEYARLSVGSRHLGQMGFNGPDTLFARSPYYSALTREVANIPAKSQQAGGWALNIAGLVKAGKVKQDEVNWTGVLDWLRLQEGKVTKEQVAQYLDANGVRVEETVLGGPTPDEQRSAAQKNRDDLWHRTFDHGQWPMMIDGAKYWADDLAYSLMDGDVKFDALPADMQQGAKEWVDAYKAAQDPPIFDFAETKYGQYQLPGGTNYREVLLTLPVKSSADPARAEYEAWASRNGLQPNATFAEERYKRETGKDAPPPRSMTAMQADAAQNFKSSHWDQPNVLAHIRLNDRTDAEGKRVLFVEEIQSDWGQAAKKNGFVGPRPARDAFAAFEADMRQRFREYLRTQADELKPERREAWIEDQARKYRVGDMAKALGEYDKALELQRAEQAEDSAASKALPRAPFVTHTDKWLALALKRVIKIAVDEGYDRVAFVNGEQSAERYSLENEVSKITVVGRTDARTMERSRSVTLDLKRGGYIELGVNNEGIIDNARSNLQQQTDYKGKGLDDVIGKEIAKNVMEMKGGGTIEGDSLKVGGEGMKSFYDKIVPNTLKDVLKKLGGGALETVSVTSASSPYPRSFQSRAEADAYADANLGDHDYTVRGLSESEGTYSVYDEFDHRFVPADKTLKQPGFTLSDAILAKASEDLPQFSRNTGAGVNMQDAKAIVAAVREALPTAPPIHILESINKAPKELKADIMKAGAQDDVDAAFHNGEIYVFPNNIASIERMMFVVAHHEIRHYGFRSMLGPKAGPIFLAIHATNANVRAAAAEQVAKGYAKSRVLAVEEALADMPVEDLVKLNGFDRLIAALRDWLRSVAANLRRRGFAGLADAVDPKVWTDKDVAALIARAEGVSRGGPARYRTPGTVFGQQRSNQPPIMRGTEEQAKAAGFTMRAYRGVDLDRPFNDTGTTWLTTSKEVAESYAEEVMGYDNPGVLEVMVNPDELPRHDASRLTDEQREQLQADDFGNPQAIGIYDRSDDHPLGGSRRNVTVIHAPKESVFVIDGGASNTQFARSGGFASAKAMSDVTNTLREATRPIGTVSWWDKSIGTQYHKSTKDRDFKRVFDGYVQQTDDTAHYAIEAERLAPSILKRLESIGDAFQGLRQSGKAHMADLQAVSRALFANIEGEEGIKQVRFDDQTLRQSYNLTPKQIEMYHQARAAVDTSVERLAQTYTAQLGEDQGMDINRVKNMDLDDTAAIVKQFIQDSHDEARAAAALRKNVAIEDQDPAMDETRALEKEYSKGKPKAPTEQETAVLLARVDGMVDHARFLQQSGYMPALRFGQFAVTVTDDEGQTLHFEMFESQLAANLAAMKLRKQYPGAAVAKSVMNPEQYAMFKGVSPETVALFAKFTGADQNEAFQNYIALAKSARSVKMRQLKRKGIAGFSEDATRVLASFLTSNARQSAVNMNVGAITDALASKDLARKGDVQREAQKLHEYMGNPIEEARRLRSFMFMHFMGGSIASALVNLTQPIMQTAPYLHQFSGSKTAGIMAASAKMAVTGKIADAELRDAAERAAQDGITEPHEIHQLMADASGASFGGNLRARAAVKLWGSFFSTAEAYNRRITFLAAYQVAKQTGQGNAYEFARKAVIETQGLYAKVNRPNWSRGAVGATIFTFKQFSIAYLEWFSRLPPKQKVLAMAILLIAAGADGLPFAEDLQDVIDTIGQSLGYNTNSKKWQRKVLADAFGNDLGEILNTGLLSKSAIDVQGRLGMGNLIPGTEIFKPSESDKTRSVSEIAGPVSGVITAFQKALSKAQRGEIVGMTGAFHELAPVAVKNLLKGIDMAKTGIYKDSRGYKVADVDVVDSFIKMLGFQPSNIARNTQKFVDELQDKGMVTMMESMIADRWAQGIAQKDPDQVAAARKALASWNENNPGSRIIIKPQQLNRRVQQMDKTRSERFVKTVPKELRAGVAGELR